MTLRTRTTLDGLAFELSTRIHDVTTPRILTPADQTQRLDALEAALRLTLEVSAELRLELQTPSPTVENPVLTAHN